MNVKLCYFIAIGRKYTCGSHTKAFFKYIYNISSDLFILSRFLRFVKMLELTRMTFFENVVFLLFPYVCSIFSHKIGAKFGQDGTCKTMVVQFMCDKRLIWYVYLLKV